MDISISEGSVGSRFVSQKDIESAKEVRDEQWKAAYARLGQEPPPRPQEDSDGRSLYEKLQSQKTAKQEEWEEKTKLSNQFRSLEEDEVLFLDSVMEEKRQEERKRQDQDGEQVKSFKEAVAARTQSLNGPPPFISTPSTDASSSSAASDIRTAQPAPKRDLPPKSKTKKDQKSLLKGVVVRKKTSNGKEKAVGGDGDGRKKPAVRADAVLETAAAGASKKRSAHIGDEEAGQTVASSGGTSKKPRTEPE